MRLDPPLQRPQRPPLPLRPEGREQGPVTKQAPDEARHKIEGRIWTFLPSKSYLLSKRFEPRNIVDRHHRSASSFVFAASSSPPANSTAQNMTPLPSAPSISVLCAPYVIGILSWCQGGFASPDTCIFPPSSSSSYYFTRRTPLSTTMPVCLV